MSNLQPLGAASQSYQLTLAGEAAGPPTQVTLFDQGQVQILQAAAVGLTPKADYTLALADAPDGSGPLQPLAGFMTNPAGAAVVNAVGPLRQVVGADAPAKRRFLVIAEGKPAAVGRVVQRQR
ncbi:MAG: hypothetical protein EON94_04830 [Caulobacteraceae bacterium]|nr:MAG: hypothetical protein EON94_04830 [Caulobacteraceae bacterium]